MNMKKSVKNILQPAMERMGFELKESFTNYFSFLGGYDESTREYTLGVTVDKEHLLVPRLRVDLLFRTAFYRFSGFGIETFSKYEKLKLTYESQEELDEIMRTIVEILETFAIHFLVEFRDNYIYRHKDIQYNRSIPPETQAENYAVAHNLPMKYEAASFRNLEKRIDQMRGDSMSNWRQNFEEHHDELMSLCLYYGELCRQNDSSLEWTLGPYNHYILDSNNRTLNPLLEVIGYWNNGLDTETSLVPRELREKPKQEPKQQEPKQEPTTLDSEEPSEEALAAFKAEIFRGLSEERVEYLMANYPIDTPTDLEFFDEVDKQKNGE